MKFNFSKQDIQQLAIRFAYSPNNVEKVIRLCLILDDLNTSEEFAGKLLLKGGTAINLVAFRNCPRLSVDLDLDFAENTSKEETSQIREALNLAINKYCAENGYKVSDRSNFVMDSKSLLYPTTSGGMDKIKLDINYHSRCHVYPNETTSIPMPFEIDGTLSVAHLNIVELFAAR